MMEANFMKQLLKISDLPLSKTTVWRLIRDGKLSHYRVGNRVFFSPEHLEQFLKNCEVKSQNDAKKTNDIQKLEDKEIK